MAHIARIGSNSPKARLGIAAIYAVLVVGALTTVYPFLLMVATGMKSQNDYNDFTPRGLVPRYLVSDAALFNKYAEDKYANNLDDINGAYNSHFDKPQSVAPLPATANADSWARFEETLPLADRKAGFGEHDAAPSLLLLRYRDYLRREFKNDIRAYNAAFTEEAVGFDTVTPPFERTAQREWEPDLEKPKVRDWTAFKQTLPPNFLITATADPLYRAYLRQETYNDDLKALNTAWGTGYADWGQIILPRVPPANAVRPTQAADWEKFVRTKYPLRLLGVDKSALPAWRAFLTRRNRAGATTAALPQTVPQTGDAHTDWIAFIATDAPLAALSADSPENRWRAAIHDPAALPDQATVDARYIAAHAGEMRREYATRNFRMVADYILLHGNAVPNTVVFCLLAILSAVIVNPLCAYALSRYPLPYAYQVLLFLLATMAFPSEVALIPNFLLLRDLHLLNTVWALVLPGIANGFSIFLLKGFFDSLPKELYEAGILDGATEIGMFRTITVPLSLPIFAVIALNAFTASYGAFLFAMVVCQDPKTWTLMVWLYDLGDSAPQYVIMAALTLAALPMLVVFLFAQKIIMRGIILPSFK